MKNRLWIIAFLVFLILPVGAGSVYRAAHPDEDRQQIEEEENRRMAEIEWDKLADSCQSIDNWYNDRAPLRGPLMRLYRQANSSAEMFFEDEIVPPLDRLIRTGRLSPEPNYNPNGETLPDHWQPTAAEPEPTEELTEPETTEEPTTEEPSTEEPTTEEPTTEAETTEPEQPSSTEESSAEETTEPETTEPETTEPETTEPESTGHVHDLEKIRTVKADYEHWGYTDYRCRECGEGIRKNVKKKLVDTTPLSPRVVGQGVIIGRSNWLFLSAARSVEYYKGTNLLTNEELASYATPLVRLNERCEKRGIKLIVIIAPNKEQVYSEYMPTYTIENKEKREPRMVKYMQKKGITMLYPLEELKAGDLYHETYHRYDTHWTPYGAYIADVMIERELGMDPAEPLSIDLPGSEKKISTGDLIQLGGLSGRNYPAVKYFVPTPDKNYKLTSDKSSENGNVRRTVSNNPNGLSLVLVGDSFRVNMSGPLTHDFTKTLILHRDYLNAASMKEEILNCDVLIVEAVERFDTLLFPSVWKLLEIIP